MVEKVGKDLDGNQDEIIYIYFGGTKGKKHDRNKAEVRAEIERG